MDNSTSKTKGLRILVSGGAGFIGSNLVDSLVEEGHVVAVVDNLSSGQKDNLNKEAEFFEVDITSEDKISEVFEKFKPEVVFHLAAQIDVRASVTDPAKDVKTNVIGTINIARVALDQSVRKLIFSSTGGALYGKEAPRPTDEEAGINPISPYGLDKLAAEKYLRYFESLSDMSVTVLRYANVYGPKQNPKGKAGAIAIFADKMLSGEPIAVYGDGSSSRDYVYVGDVVRANLAALRSSLNGTYNISTGEETSLRELVDKIQKITNSSSRVEYKDSRSGELEASCLSNKRAALELDWQPEIKLEDGIRNTVEYLESLKKD